MISRKRTSPRLTSRGLYIHLYLYDTTRVSNVRSELARISFCSEAQICQSNHAFTTLAEHYQIKMQKEASQHSDVEKASFSDEEPVERCVSSMTIGFPLPMYRDVDSSSVSVAGSAPAGSRAWPKGAPQACR